MQGFAERKREEKAQLEGEKKKTKQHHMMPSMSEGPMLIDETASIEARARASFEKGVKIELAAMKGRKKRKKGRKSGKRRRQ